MPNQTKGAAPTWVPGPGVPLAVPEPIEGRAPTCARPPLRRPGGRVPPARQPGRDAASLFTAPPAHQPAAGSAGAAPGAILWRRRRGARAEGSYLHDLALRAERGPGPREAAREAGGVGGVVAARA